MQDTIWITKDGRVLLVSQMSTDHILNCIDKIRRDNWRIEYLDRLLLELTIREVQSW